MGAVSELTFEEWIDTVPKRMKSDPLWQSIYYCKGMYLYDLVWHDCELLRRDFRGREIANQLIRSTGSICANMEEAFGRGVGTADFVRILRISLGETRESKGWYFRSRYILPESLINKRIDLVSQIIALLVNNINQHRMRLDSSKS